MGIRPCCWVSSEGIDLNQITKVSFFFWLCLFVETEQLDQFEKSPWLFSTSQSGRVSKVLIKSSSSCSLHERKQ